MSGHKGKRSDYVILETTADKLELPVAIYLSTQECCVKLNITNKSLYCKITRQQVDQKRKTRFVRVYIGADNERERQD